MCVRYQHAEINPQQKPIQLYKDASIQQGVLQTIAHLHVVV